jgi:membrane fusion protein (multidrug efflux system)
MNTKAIIITIATAALFGSGCSSNGDDKETEKKTTIAAAPPAPATFALAKGSLHTELKIPSELIAYRQTDIYAKVNSYVKNLTVDVGSQVKQGQVLATLEAPELVQQLAASQSKYKAQQAIYDQSNATYERTIDASKTPGTISKNDVDIASAKRNSDLAQMQAAKADYEATSTIAQYLTIRAPFDGVISARNVNLGAYIGPAGKGSELPIFTLAEQQHLRLVIEIPEAYKNFIKINDVVKFSVKAFPDQSFSAKIARRAGVMDKTLRSEHVELDVINNDLKLSPGMIAEAVIGLNADANAFVVPKGAVVNSTNGVFMIEDSANFAKRIPVRLGRVTDSLAEVFGQGLKVDTRYVAKGSEEIKNGAAITH